MKRMVSVIVFLAMTGSLFAQEGDHEMKITSAAFTHNQMIPEKYTCQGEDINPPLKVEGVPPDTKSLLLVVDDPDAPFGTWVHWIVVNIVPANAITIEENTIPGDEILNDFGKVGYGGPCPPSGTHRYFFKLYALDTSISLLPGATKEQILKEMQGHILAQGELMGTFSK